MAPRPDVCYMLIGLFADRGNYCNGSLFAPDSYTNDLLDYRYVLNMSLFVPLVKVKYSSNFKNSPYSLISKYFFPKTKGN